MITTGTIFVVEGKSDQALLSSFYRAYIVQTDGYNVSRETIANLKALEKLHKIVIITDQDKAGVYIKDMLIQHLTNYHVITLPFIKEKNSKKIGLAETKRSIIKEAIAPYLVPPFASSSNLTWEITLDHYERANNKDKWMKNVCETFSLCFGSLKKIYAQLLLLNINSEDLEKISYE